MTERMRIPVPKPRPAPTKISDALFNRPGFRIPSGDVEIRIVKERGPRRQTHWTEHSSYSDRVSIGMVNAIEVIRNNNP